MGLGVEEMECALVLGHMVIDTEALNVNVDNVKMSTFFLVRYHLERCHAMYLHPMAYLDTYSSYNRSCRNQGLGCSTTLTRLHKTLDMCLWNHTL